MIIADTDHFGNAFTKLSSATRKAWPLKCFIRGLHPIPILMDWYSFGNPSGFYTAEEQEAIRVAMGQTLSYAKKVNLGDMRPQNSLASTGYCLASSGKEYLVYVPSEGNDRWYLRWWPLRRSRVTVDLSAASGGLNIEWFNPSTGVAETGGKTIGGATRSFTAPFSGDAVLYIWDGTPAPPSIKR